MKTILLIMIAICASVVFAQDKSLVAQAMAACGADNIEFSSSKSVQQSIGTAILGMDAKGPVRQSER